ncbi:MAG: hypothetical protein AAGA99_27220 [Actinomycetota bacterium]
MAKVVPKTMAAFHSGASVVELSDALAAALTGRGHSCSPSTSIERATEFNVELGGRLVSILIGEGPRDATDRFLSVGKTLGPTASLIRLSDGGYRSAVVETVDEALRNDLAIQAEWHTPADWRAMTTT